DDNAITERFDVRDRHIHHLIVVFDNQYSRGADARKLLRGHHRLVFHSGLISCYRQIKRHSGASTYLAVDLHLPARLFDETVYLAEPEAAAPGGIFGREKRVEDPWQIFRRNAAAVIADCNHHV